MQQLRKDNHYVPELYLKQWADKDGVLTYRLLVPNENVGAWKKHSLKGIGYQKHLYTYWAGGEETDEFECWLDREFESPAHEAIRRVVQEDRLEPEHWRRLVRFAMAQDVRTPARLKEFIRSQNATLKPLMDEVMQRSIHEMEDAVQRGIPMPQMETDDIDPFPLFKTSIEPLPEGGGAVKVETIVGRQMWIWNMKRILTQTIKKLPKHRWTILHAPPGLSWPTSDNPLIKLNYQDSKNYDTKGGWGVNRGDILLPLSPKHLLHTCIGQRGWPRGTTLTSELAQGIRRIIIEHAHQYVFAKEPGDIHLIRPRMVCPETCKQERAAWDRWHVEQCAAEREMQAR
ncbi:DUF4238 domain-containing protein [Pseudomonas sp. B8(2017)]|uniref:DUF4238 domain-containing protein n=1 Tax=Pseudomonas sp. B8(2017) TaxID=1981711 RepID=UPI000A1F3D95|nr:DUF4238 domain-containing protein [Pseudomonas sp. B8(2017)]